MERREKSIGLERQRLKREKERLERELEERFDTLSSGNASPTKVKQSKIERMLHSYRA